MILLSAVVTASVTGTCHQLSHLFSVTY